MIDERAVEIWNDELEELFLRTGHRFRRVEPRRLESAEVVGLVARCRAGGLPLLGTQQACARG
ncbi:hypothetical protein [Streptomyces incarnatus]|uniref:hypothetical protein n=1 Tax=Streptomyces incarnatus TaxID=665007 RepID=UPI000A8D3169|nr:hypothetical protein [Streptomyces incarnatus]